MQKPRNDIPTPSVRRLSLYLRELESLQNEEYDTIASGQLAEILGLTAAQVRKDLTYLGQFGRTGVGYEIPTLVKRLRKTLGADKTSKTLIVGVGNIGRAIATYSGFIDKQFELVALFDSDPKKIGKKIGRKADAISILPLKRLKPTIQKHKIRMAILTVPANDAQDVADRLIKAGIRGILNFAPIHIEAPDNVKIRSLDVATELEQLNFMTASR